MQRQSTIKKTLHLSVPFQFVCEREHWILTLNRSCRQRTIPSRSPPPTDERCTVTPVCVLRKKTRSIRSLFHLQKPKRWQNRDEMEIWHQLSPFDYKYRPTCPNTSESHCFTSINILRKWCKVHEKNTIRCYFFVIIKAANAASDFFLWMGLNYYMLSIFCNANKPTCSTALASVWASML